MIRFLVFSLFAASACWAQSVTCSPSVPTPLILRSEGLTERVGDIVLNCNSALAAGTRGDLKVYLSNTIVTNPATSTDLTTALMNIGEPSVNSQILGQNVFQGSPLGVNSLVWRNVPLDGTRTFRLTNIRVSGAMSGAGGKVDATVVFMPSGSNAPAYASPALRVATTQAGMVVNIARTLGFSACTATTGNFQIRFSETFPASFKEPLAEGGVNTRLGLPGSPGGTRLKVVFDAMSQGTLSVSTAHSTGTSSSARAKFVGGGTVSSDGTMVQLAVVEGKATAIWEIVSADLTNVEIVTFQGTLVTTTGGAAASSPTPGPYCATASFAPIWGAPDTVPATPLSRFSDYPSALTTLGLSGGAGLLFPFTTNSLGFDTGLTVARTLLDPFVSTSSKGCSLSVYGSNTPGAYATPRPFAEVGTCASTTGPDLKLQIANPLPPGYVLSPQTSTTWSTSYLAQLLGLEGTSTLATLDLGGATAPITTNGASATYEWLSATVYSNTTPTTLEFKLDPSRLAPGSYTGNVTVRTDRGASQIIPLNMTVPAAAPAFERAGVTHAASYKPGFVAPGQLTVIFGSGFGPSTLISLILGADGKVTTSLGNTRVLFDGVAAPMVYAVNGQVSAVAPFSLAGKSSTKVQVEYNGVASAEVTLPVLQQNPSLVTLYSDGGGQVAALNQDGTLNTPTAGAPVGSIVTLYGTGGGQTNPASADGQVGGPANAVFPVPMTVEIGGRPAEIVYQGPAPTLVAGVFQLNVRIPAGVSGPALPIVVRQGSQASQTGNTLSVR